VLGACWTNSFGISFGKNPKYRRSAAEEVHRGEEERRGSVQLRCIEKDNVHKKNKKRIKKRRIKRIKNKAGEESR
jgi:hypothetical protein